MDDPRQLSVLLVEDSEVDAEYVRRTLPVEVRVEHVRGLDGALEALASSRLFDCAIVDLNLGDGRQPGEVVAAVRRCSSVPIVAFSGAFDAAALRQTMTRGADAWCDKSEELGDLWAAVRRAMVPRTNERVLVVNDSGRERARRKSEEYEARVRKMEASVS